MKKIVKGLIVFVVTIIFTDCSINNIYFSFFFKIDNELNSDGQKYIDQFTQDLNFLENNNPFGVNTKDNDAGVVLNHLVSFYSFPNRELPIGEYLGISKEIWTKIQSKNWMSDFSTTELQSLNFKWIEDLRNFDHWNIFKDERLLAQFESLDSKTAIERAELLSELSIPDFVGLMHASRLYLYREIQGPDPIRGLENHRRLAKILFYSGELTGAMTSLGMLHDENIIIEKTKFSSEKWMRVEGEHINKLKRAIWAWSAYLNPILISKFYPKLNIYLATRSPTYCAANLESLKRHAIVFDFSKQKLPFERGLYSFGSNKILEYTSNICGHADLYNKILTRPKSDLFFSYDRSTIGGFIFKAGQPDFFRLYKTQMTNLQSTE